MSLRTVIEFLSPASRSRAGRVGRIGAALLAGLSLAVAGGCGNNPYPSAERELPLVYSWRVDDPKTLDPTIIYDLNGGPIAGSIYATFLQYHYLKQEPFELELGLGAEMPRREPFVFTEETASGRRRVRGERWTFRIRKGLRFQDDPCFPGGRGREILASDFIHSFKRMAEPELDCPIVNFLTDKVVGFGAYYERQRALSKEEKPADYSYPVAGLQVDPEDPYVFRILLNQPYPQLRYLMAMTFTTPLAPEATRRYGEGLGRHPVGSGPYVLEEWLPKQRIVLKPNPNYRRDDLYPREGMPGDREAGLLEDAGERLPLNGGAVYSIIREGITAWNLFQQGYLDAYAVTQETRGQAVSRVGTVTPQMAAKGVSLDQATQPMVYYFGFNMQDPVVGGYAPKRRKLRQALSLCYDAQAELDLMNAGLGQPAEWMIPPSVTGYDEEYRNAYRRGDLEQAKRLLAEAGYPDGIDPKTGRRLTITYDNAGTDAAGRQFSGLVQKQFEQIGVRVESRPALLDEWRARVRKGQYQFTSLNWIADYPDPENFLLLLHGPNLRPGPNYTGYDRKEYNALFERMRGMDDGPEREAIMRRMRAMAVEDCPLIPRYFDENFILTYDWYRNAVSHPLAMDALKYQRVDAPVRTATRARWNRPNLGPVFAVLVLLVGGSIPAMATARRRARQTARRRR